MYGLQVARDKRLYFVWRDTMRVLLVMYTVESVQIAYAMRVADPNFGSKAFLYVAY